MPFPFIPGGALLALAVLGGAFALFGLALKALDWTIDATRASMLNGVVSGMRDGERRSRRVARPISTATSTPPAAPYPVAQPEEAATIPEVDTEYVVPTEPVHRPR
jgi:hypothetical protein